MKVENEDFLKEIFGAIQPVIDENQKKVVEKKIEEYATYKAYSFAKTFIPSVYALISICLFMLANFCVWWIIYRAFITDIEFLKTSKEYKRLITPEVIMALISGITIQTATAFLIITKFFFQKPELHKNELASH